ncbi:hypothetical protein ACF0H5_005896 [Mactra antiquata]
MKITLCTVTQFCLILIGSVFCYEESDLEYPYKSSETGRQKRDCTKYSYGPKTSITYVAHKTLTDNDNHKLTLPIAESHFTTATINQYYYSENDIQVHLAYIHDPVKTVSVYEPLRDGTCSNYTRATVLESAINRNCILATNAGFFSTSTGECLGNIVSDGRLVQDSEGIQNPHFGITKSGQLFFGYLSEIDLIADDFEQLVGGVIWILKDNETYIDESIQTECRDTEETGTLQRFASVISARTVIGHDSDGRIIIAQFEGKTDRSGANLFDAAKIMKKYGAINAINLDGGGSSTLVINNTLVNIPSDFCGDFQCARNVSTILCVHEPYCEVTDCNNHGTCELGVCSCHGYWSGSDCNVLQCPEDCNHNGDCTQDGCICLPGYHGDNCSKSCDDGWYGNQCKQQCQCENNSTCDITSGSCICLPGYTGNLCQYRCPLGYYGNQCSSQCNCRDNCFCDPVNGSCSYTYTNGDYVIAGTCLNSVIEKKHSSSDGVFIKHNVAITAVIVIAIVLLLSVTLNIILIWKYCSKRCHSNKKVKYQHGRSSGNNQMFVFHGKQYSSFTTSTCSDEEETSLIKLPSR